MTTDANADMRPVPVESFYAYGFRGRPMLAIRSPFSMGGDGVELVGRIIEVNGLRGRVVAISRQISGPIALGEPIGVETEPADTDCLFQDVATHKSDICE